MKKWGIVLIVIAGLMLACVGLVIVANFAYLPRSSRVIKVGPVRQVEVMPTGQATAEEVVEQNFSVSGPAMVKLDNGFGSVEITGQAGLKEIQVKATKKSWALNQQTAQERLQKTEIRMTQSGDTVTIKIQEPMEVTNGRPVEVVFTILVPTETSVDARTASGNLTVDSVSGAVNVSSAFGSVQASRIQGELSAETSSGEVEANEISAGEKDILISSSFGSVSLHNAQAAAITLETKSGEVRLVSSKASGGATLKSSFGSITATNGEYGWVNAYTQSGEVELTGIQAAEKVKVFSSFGALRLSQVHTPLYDLATHSGDVRLDGASGKVIADVEQGSVKILDGENVTLDLKSQSGDLEYAGSLGDAPSTLTSTFGSIRLALPADSAFHADLESKFGTIRSDFEVTMGGTLDDNHWVGTVNGGGSELKASTSGDIRLESRE